MKHLFNLTDLGARVFLAAIFVIAGASKISAYEATQGYMQAMGVPGFLLPLVIALELGGGLALMGGFQTRIAALLLAGFSLLAAVIFHFDPSDQMQTILLWKNVGLAGGLLMLTLHGAGPWSLDARRKPVVHAAGHA